MKTKEILKLLREARRAATFQNISLRFPTDEDYTKKVKEDTRLYRDTWIVAPLDEVIAEIENEQARRRKTA